MNDKLPGFTQEQIDAINYDYCDGSLLVSAAAGSGKSTVLVERLVKRIEMDVNANIDEFLVITYTRAAAEDIREKIKSKLHERINSNPGNKNLRRQLHLSKTASIGTIHTFCSEILRENAYQSLLPPDFRVLDENESTLIMNEIAENVLLNAYVNFSDNNDFRSLIDTISEGRDDKQLITVLLDIYKKLQSTSNPIEWIHDRLEKLRPENLDELFTTSCGAYILEKLLETVAFCREDMLFIRDKMYQLDDYGHLYADNINDILFYLDNLLTSLSEKDWDTAKENCDFNHVKTKFTKILKGFNKSDILIETRERVIKNLKICDEELKFSSDEHKKEMMLVNVAITELLRLVLTFTDMYAAEKLRRGVVDFSDLEHLTLSLLTDENSENKKSSLAISISERYKEILVDEYQDVNEVQELIFSKIVKKDNNLFMVGDVKQSIYRFRLADPMIFLDKKENFSLFNGNKTKNSSKNGSTIHLSTNFRSAPGILDAVNIIFRSIMSKGFGEMEYGLSDELFAPAADTKKGKQGKKGIQGIENSKDSLNPSVEIEVIDMSTLKSDADEESPAAISIEAGYIAQKIAEMIRNNEKINIRENGIIIGERNIEYGDIAILLRSVKHKAQKYALALKTKGISVEFTGDEGFFDTVEVTTTLALLSIIDNPLQDIPLAAVMAGPLYNFSSDDLATIRSKTQKTDLFTALKNVSENNIGSCELSVKCTNILNEINDLREISADMPSDRFIWHVYNRTGLPGIFGAMKNGNQRRDNLIKLAESARKFEGNGYKGLFGFLTYILNLRDSGREISDNPGEPGRNNKNTSTGNSVKIMSIHKSKGLEFPIVFLAGTGGKFNFPDIRNNVVFHKDIGIGSMLTENSRRIKYSTLPRDAILRKLKEEMLSEELRVLYVAMTRAEEKLFITGTHRFLENTTRRISLLPPGKIHPQVMISFQNPVEWLLAGVRECKKINVKYITADELIKPDLLDRKHLHQQKCEDVISNIDESCYEEFDYPHKNLTDIRSKITVTEKSKLADPDDEAENLFFIREKNLEYINCQPLSFIDERKHYNSATQGTIMHTVMRHIDYNIGSDDYLIENELNRLVYDNFLSEDECALLDKKKIKRFLGSNIAKRIRASNNVWREFRFSILCAIEKSIDNKGVDKQLLQGVIDCYFEENDELVIIDFKTDKVTSSTIKEKARHYTPQLNEYAEALKRINKGSKIKEKILYFFDMENAEEYIVV